MIMMDQIQDGVLRGISAADTIVLVSHPKGLLSPHCGMTV